MKIKLNLPYKKQALERVQSILYRQSFEALHNISSGRLRLFGGALFAGNLLFAWIWSSILPQPYESIFLRFVLALLGGLIAVRRFEDWLGYRLFTLYCLGVTWLCLPAFFAYMLIKNQVNEVWVHSCTAMLLIYFQVLDWRVAVLGMMVLVLGLILGGYFVDPTVFPILMQLSAEQWVVLAFSFTLGLSLSFTSASLRKAEIGRSLTLMGIMAHELRTPMASIQLGVDVLESEGANRDLLYRIRTAIKRVHWNIDTQMNNARLGRKPAQQQKVNMGSVLRKCVEAYPYRSHHESASVQLNVQSDFSIETSSGELRQVFENLLKNALYSLAKTQRLPTPGDIQIICSRNRGGGIVTVADKGAGMPRVVQKNLFKPFFSTNQQTAHGLGLAFCKHFMQSMRGSISCQSMPNAGAVFTLRFPQTTAPIDEEKS